MYIHLQYLRENKDYYKLVTRINYVNKIESYKDLHQGSLRKKAQGLVQMSKRTIEESMKREADSFVRHVVNSTTSEHDIMANNRNWDPARIVTALLGWSILIPEAEVSEVEVVAVVDGSVDTKVAVALVSSVAMYVRM